MFPPYVIAPLLAPAVTTFPPLDASYKVIVGVAFAIEQLNVTSAVVSSLQMYPLANFAVTV